MEVLSWLIRSVPLASAAALAQMLAPSALSLRVIPSSSSMPVLAWTAVPAQIPAPTALSLPLNNQNRTKNTGLLSGVFLTHRKETYYGLSYQLRFLLSLRLLRK
jgi:hypothetical protein